MQEHERYMQRCLELARLGAGSVSPNPMVGAVLVRDGKIVAENYHRRYGGPHAEALVVAAALDAYGAEARSVFREATLYVSLEPCAHQGKTPPCAQLLADQGIGRVVVACRDPFDQVNGQGIRMLEAAGIEVIEGVLEAEARWLNRRFMTRLAVQRPYIILKWAQTADGYMAPTDGGQKWITGAAANQLVHRWRSEEDAVLVGAKTALADDPQLTVREWRGRNPKRVLVDRQLVTPAHAKLYDGAAETLVFNASRSEWRTDVKYIALEDFDRYLPQQIAYQLYLLDVQSVIVEGGRKTLELFIEAGLWDEARVFSSATAWGAGVTAPVLHGKAAKVQAVGQDTLSVYYRD